MCKECVRNVNWKKSKDSQIKGRKIWLTRTNKDGKFYFFDLEDCDVEVSLSGDEFRMNFDWDDVPFDHRLVVEVARKVVVAETDFPSEQKQQQRQERYKNLKI